MTSASTLANPPAKLWLADEMLGRLARYLRFLGWDTEYVRGLDDGQVAELATSAHRILLTRDRALAARVERSLLLRTIAVRDQLGEVFARFPDEPRDLRFDRCPEDNEPLLRVDPMDGSLPEHVPRDLAQRQIPLWRCPRCGRFYWEGSHADTIRRVVSESRPRDGAA